MNRAVVVLIVLAVVLNVTFVFFASAPTPDASSPDSSGATAGTSDDGTGGTTTVDWRSLYTVLSNDTSQGVASVKWTDDQLSDPNLDAIFVKYAFDHDTILTVQAKKPDGSWDTLAKNQFCEPNQLQTLDVFFTERIGNTVTLSFSSSNYYPPHFVYLALLIYVDTSRGFPGHGPLGASWLTVTAAVVGIISIIAVIMVITWKLIRR